uniref:Uncharacterized protein n=1 Tax=Nelumbo nucifera TaxID=4432 RepID=A0A822YK63_NELNU|nr:TPA_asm: hypothetical protein HUJ06_011743 [Nelumbo nucifera]
MNNINRRTANGTHHEQQLPENHELTEDETKRLPSPANNELEQESQTDSNHEQRNKTLKNSRGKPREKLKRKALSKQREMEEGEKPEGERGRRAHAIRCIRLALIKVSTRY